MKPKPTNDWQKKTKIGHCPDCRCHTYGLSHCTYCGKKLDMTEVPNDEPHL